MGHLAGSERATLNTATAETRLLQRLDPRTRVICVLVFAVCVVALSSPLALAVALAVPAAFMLVQGLLIGKTLRRMAAMDGFIIFMLVLLPFTTAGPAAFTLFGFDASTTGIWKAVEIGLTANAIILMVLVLVGTLEPGQLGHALARLKAPETLVHLMLFTVRYISVLQEEYTRLRAAMKMRGFTPKNTLHTYRSFGYLVGMLLVRAVDRSERILDAMKCRGFDGRLYLLDDLRYSKADFTFALVFSGALVVLIGLEVFSGSAV
ncbi:cobalt ECF transporter T component CbiQ [Pseudovibrio sp. SPO723]|uniref:cobalt ECF transporter T component CbiQ n=1 Tax=Nesiotobacter zosterae TaxID=392721 RepID=UPI0029C5124D|nr:cobalt ECF transporter T component CbiQ [Pseudovibrio sp. SPO723]MDX5593263.1 cobalt ECF transporter T component CbiQ [Pseudovibrio sp. SPO723]